MTAQQALETLGWLISQIKKAVEGEKGREEWPKAEGWKGGG